MSTSIEELYAEQHRLKARIQELRTEYHAKIGETYLKLLEVEHEITAAGATIEYEIEFTDGSTISNRPSRSGRPASPYTANVAVEDVAGLSVDDSLILIGKRNGNVLKVTPARRLLVEAGVVEEGQGGRTAVNHAIQRLGRRLKRTRIKGTYEVVDADEEANDQVSKDVERIAADILRDIGSTSRVQEYESRFRQEELEAARRASGFGSN